jgi:hypothetical protein
LPRHLGQLRRHRHHHRAPAIQIPITGDSDGMRLTSPALSSRLPLLQLRTNHAIFDVVAASTNIKLQLEKNFTVKTLLQKKKVSQTFLDLADGFTPCSSAGH